ncbi:mRNA cap guanine-N7 methyltransferase [Hondaea fermentalgiana]|uniref:mRNA (guanine-N(7))-methyltransferase n=1 Tax=Hondaea fermentalgiana TaxID=2315210 RepID=A0A2R5G770_9STRA|nr:mRNA cap guanine-N7 methyltransferase [Hondaea fermentalgiana]|eukprot:GBG26906.1 mRNA cap guanine-N7 methyltransferase [Hondaea fermentalgiana]
MAETPVVKITQARESRLGDEVLALFDKRCRQLMERILDERQAPAHAPLPDESVIEIEARTGKKGKDGFVPGVGRRFFSGMLDYFLRKEKSGTWMRADERRQKVGFKHTDFVDVVFQDDVRVTVRVERGANERVENIEVQEVITKRKLGKANDFIIKSPALKAEDIHLRIGIAVEEHIRENTREHEAHVCAAKRAINDAFNVSTRVKLLGGIELTLRKGAQPVGLMFPPDNEQLARGPMGFADPLYIAAKEHNDMLDARLAGQLKWTLLQPSNLPGCKGRPNVALRDKKTLEPKLFLTNLPGIVQLSNGAKYAAYACQYIIRAPLADILCGHGTFANDVSSDEQDTDQGPDLPIKVFRRKKRWSFELRHNQHLDMTESRQSSNLATLNNEPPVFEVEIEKTLSSAGCRKRSLGELAFDLNAVALADAFLADIASRIYGAALPPLQLETAPGHWREQAEKDKTRTKRFKADLAQADETAKDNYKDAMQLDAPELADQKASAGFYNKLDRSSEAKRSDSLIYHMRCLNNFVKNVVIKEALSRSLDSTLREPGSGIKVLDLACGKGADMRKITTSAKALKVRIDQYVGVDIARNSLDDAVSRLDAMASKRPNFSIRYVEADLGQHFLNAEANSEEDFRLLEQWDNQSQTWSKKPPSQTLSMSDSFDLVTMQFSMHYMFQNYERASHFFSTLGRHMRPGSVFVATTVYADEMVRKLMEAGPGADSFTIRDDAGVATCHVKFDPAFLSQFLGSDSDGDVEMTGSASGHDVSDPMMGIRYTFRLLDGDSDDAQAVNAPEWLVPQALLVKLATVHNFNLVRYERLPNCASRHINHDGNRHDALYRLMNVLNHRGTVSGTEWDIASLYVVVELQKEHKPAGMREALTRLKERIPNYKELPSAEKQLLLDTILKQPE